MKSSLLISVLLLAPALICLVDGAQFTRGFCLQLINNGKSAFAKEYHVANMNGLSYDKKLEKKILEQLSFTNGCPEPSIISHKGFDIYLNINNEDSIIDLLSGVGKTTMACIKTKCEENGEEFISIVTDYSDIPATSGAPGSQCSDSRTVNSDGLCIRGNHRNGYERKFFGSIDWEKLKEDIEKITEETSKTAEEVSKEMAERIEQEARVIGESKAIDLGKMTKIVEKIAADASKKVSEKINEIQRQSGRKYVRKGFLERIWSASTPPPFVPHSEYKEYVPNEKGYWPHRPITDPPIIWN